MNSNALEPSLRPEFFLSYFRCEVCLGAIGRADTFLYQHLLAILLDQQWYSSGRLSCKQPMK